MSDSTTANQAPAAPAVVVPDYLKAFATGQQANSDSESMAASSTSVPRVSLRGKKFRFIEGGEEIFTQNDEVDVVILGVTPEAGLFVKTFYINGYTGTSDNAPPTCSSDDGRRPCPWILGPQLWTHNHKIVLHVKRIDSARLSPGQVNQQKLVVIQSDCGLHFQTTSVAQYLCCRCQ